MKKIFITGIGCISLAAMAFINSSIGSVKNLPQVAVQTKSIGYITANSATCYFSVTDPARLKKTIGVCISKGNNPTISGTKFGLAKGCLIGPVNFCSDMTGLSPLTTYYVRAYATTAGVTVYGNTISFTTLKPVK